MLRRLLDWADEFPPGRVPLLLLVLALASGTAVAVRQVRSAPPRFSVWTFVHLAGEEFQQRLAADPAHADVEVRNLGTAMFDRLALAVMTRTELPNLVEIEQSVIGRYLRGPVEHIPFVDLTERLEREGWFERCVPARFARYTVGGRTFGLPHDLHPMVLVYRPDVLAELGYRPEDLATWDDWCAAARRFYRPGALGTRTWRRGMPLSTIEGYTYLALLWQRGGDMFDATGEVTLDSPLAVDTLERYLAMLGGDPPAAGPALSSMIEDFAALSRGQFLGLLAADWMLAVMQKDGRTLLEGRVQIMPLPAWERGGRRTTTVGGTALCIPKDAGPPDRAWEIAKLLYFDHRSLVERFRTQSIVPLLRASWTDPVFDEPAPFFQNQRIGRVLTELADEVPPVHGSPYMAEGYKLLDAVFADVTAGRVTPRAALAGVAAELRARMARDRAAVARARAGSAP